MSFINPCMSSLALISGFTALSLITFTTNKYKQLYDTFDNEEQKQMYYIVGKERLQIHSIAYGFSITIALIYAYAVNKRNKNINYCLFSLIIHALALVIYKYYPKKYNLKPYLTSQEQLQKYDSLKNQMKKSYIFGLIIGIGLYILIETKCKKH